MGSGNSSQNFIATVAVKIDEASLASAGAAIRRSLEDATKGIDLAAFKQLAEATKAMSGELGKAAINAEKLATQQAKTAEADEKTAAAKLKTETAAQRLEQTQRRNAEQSERAARAETLAYEKQLAATAQITQAENNRIAAERELAAALEQQRAVLAQQAQLSQQIQNAVAKPVGLAVNPNFNLGNLAGTLGNNFIGTLLSGGGLSSALSASLGQLQPALFQIAQGGAQATAAFNALGIEGVGAVSSLTSGMAALGVAALAVIPAISAIGNGIKAAYEQQKEFIFNSGLLAKQLGTTAEEGAKLRAALTLVGQQDNIFAAITLNQIQASVAAIDRVNRGLDVATPQVEKFAAALKSLGVDYANQNGSLKTFAELTVDISAGLQKLDAAQRSLAIQNLAGLFGGDVAKIFGYGPEGLSSILANATVVTEQQAKANDNLQISLTNLNSAQNQFNITLTNGITPLETWFNQFKTGALREASDELSVIISRLGSLGEVLGISLPSSPEGLGRGLVGIFSERYGTGGILPDAAGLREEAKRTVDFINSLSSQLTGGPQDIFLSAGIVAATANLKLLEARIDSLSSKQGAVAKIFDPGGPTNQVLIDQYKQLDKALEQVQKDQEAVAKAQEAVAKNNAEVAKSFDAQIDALQRTAGAYDSYYTKIGDISTKIGEIQAKQGKQYSFIGTGTVKDVEKAIVDLRVLEERLGKLDKKLDPGSPRYDQLALNIKRRREALGLQPGELTDIANVDVTVGISGLSRADKEKLNELFQQLAKFKQEFLQGGFDITQSTFGILSESIKNLGQPQFLDFLSKGATTLQDYANSLGLFATPGFTQAIGEAALQQKLLAGGFGEIQTAEGAAAAFEKYVKAFGDFRSALFDLSEYIADPSKLKLDTLLQDFKDYEKNPTKVKIPIAIELGLVSEGNVSVVTDTNALAYVGQRERAALLAEAEPDLGAVGSPGALGAAQGIRNTQNKIASLGTSQGIVAAVLARWGVTPGQAVKASVNFAIDLKADNSLVEKQLKAQRKLADDLTKTRTLNAQWNLNINLSSNIEDIRAYLQRVITALGLPGGTVPGPKTGAGTAPPPIIDQNDPDYRRAAGGTVFRGKPYLVGEEGKPEFFVPRADGRIIPGNETASILRLMGNERFPSQANITYAPVSNQYLSVDARGTNARDVTQAIQRTQRKGSLFTSSSDLIRGRDFLRARGL